MMTLGTLIPLVTWALFFVFLRNRGHCWRTAFLAAAILWGVSVTLITELLSLFAALNRSWLALGWASLVFVVGATSIRTGSFPKPKTSIVLSRAEKLGVVTITIILAFTFIIAIVAPPNSWDSMTYHMTRVMNWIQQESINHFPTNNLRQLELNPWAEYAILQFQLLSGGDYLANLVQWFSMAGCIIGVSLISQLLAAPVRGQLLSGLIAATIPMAILQSSSTQNDLVVSFWLVCFIVFGMLSMREKSLAWTILMSSSLGLALLTKGTAYLFSAPFLFWFFLHDVKRSWRQAVWKYLILGSIVLMVNLGHFQRNFQLFHSPLHSGTTPYSNSLLSPAVVISNISRNLAIHILTPSITLNSILITPLKLLHSAMGIAIDDPDTTWKGQAIEKLVVLPHEDLSGNPLHLILFIVCVPVLACKKNLREALPYSLAVLGGFLFFCMMLRWQPWASRLQLPLFLLFSPVAGLVVVGMGKRFVEQGIVLFLTLAAFPWLIFNLSRPVVSFKGPYNNYPSIFTLSRNSLYFNNIPESKQKFLDASAVISSNRFKNIGLKSGGDSWEYPLWVLTRNDGTNGPRIEHVDVDNVSNNILRSPFKPDCLVVITSNGEVSLEVPRL